VKTLQRFYLVEVLSGVALTAAHFFRNMAAHTAHALGRKDARGAVTIQYPEERRPTSPRLRSLHRLVRRADGSPRCDRFWKFPKRSSREKVYSSASKS